MLIHIQLHPFHTLLKDFIYLFLERGGGEDKEREKNIDVRENIDCLGVTPHTQAWALTGNRTGNQQPFPLQDNTQPNELQQVRAQVTPLKSTSSWTAWGHLSTSSCNGPKLCRQKVLPSNLDADSEKSSYSAYATLQQFNHYFEWISTIIKWPLFLLLDIWLQYWRLAPQRVRLSGLSASLQTKGSPLWFPVRAHAWVAGQVPSRGCLRGNHTLMFLSLFLPPSPSVYK